MACSVLHPPSTRQHQSGEEAQKANSKDPPPSAVKISPAQSSQGAHRENGDRMLEAFSVLPDAAEPSADPSISGLSLTIFSGRCLSLSKSLAPEVFNLRRVNAQSLGEAISGTCR